MAQAKDDNKQKFLEVKTNGGRLVFVLGNGQKLIFDPAQCNEDIRQQAMFHGFNQKIRDAAAGFSKEKDFAGAIGDMNAVMEALYGGDWNRKGGATGTNLEDLANAIARFKNVTFERAMAAVAKGTPEQRAEWMKNKTVAAFAAQARADRLAAAIATNEAPDLEIDLGGDDE